MVVRTIPGGPALSFDLALGAERHLLASLGARAPAYASIHRAAQAIVPLHAFYLCLYEPKNRRLRFEYNGDDDGLDTPETFALGSGPTSRAVRTGKPHVINHFRDEGSSTLTFGNPGRRSRGAIHLPFWDGAPGATGGGPPLGVLSVQSYTLDAYDRRQVEAVRWLAARAAHLLRDTEAQVAEAAARAAQAEEGRRRRLERIVGILDAHGTPPELRAAILRELGDEPAPVRRLDTDALTDRELQAVALVAQGLTYGRIADVLVVGKETVKTHVRRAYPKLGLSDGRALPRHLSDLLAAVAARGV